MRYLYHYFLQSGKVMLQWLKFLFGLRLALPLLLLVSTGMVSSCSKLPLGLLSGGTNVAANTQIGKTTNQNIGNTQNTEQKIVRPQARTINQSSDTSEVKADTVDSITVNNIPPWFIIFFMLWSLFLWELPRPSDIGRGIGNFFQKYLTFKNKS